MPVFVKAKCKPRDNFVALQSFNDPCRHRATLQGPSFTSAETLVYVRFFSFHDPE